MKIRFDLFELKSFNLNKEINSLYNAKKIKDLKDNIILKDLRNKIKHLKELKTIEEITYKMKNCHKLAYDKENIVKKIYEKCYGKSINDLYSIINYDNQNSITMYQLGINSRSRLIFVVVNEIIYPLIFDLRHCIDPSKKKNHDNNSKQEKEEWDFNDLKKEIEKNK